MDHRRSRSFHRDRAGDPQGNARNLMTNIGQGGVDYSDDPLLPPWYIAGWTSQNVNVDTLPAPANPFAPYDNLPVNFSYVNVIGNYDDADGNQTGGYLTFEQSNDLLVQDPLGTYYRMPKRFVGQVPMSNLLAWNAQGSGRIYIQFGQLNVILFATDQPNATVVIQEPYNKTQEAGYVATATWVYHVKEYFNRGMKYDILVPSSDVGTPVDINTLIVASTYEPNHDWNRGF
jgi:hypothetical protein